MYELNLEPFVRPEIPPEASNEERNRIADDSCRSYLLRERQIIDAHESLAQEYAESIGRTWWPRKYELTFSEPVELYYNISKRVTNTVHTVKLFVSDRGSFAYTFHKSSGYAFSNDMVRKLVRMRLITQDFYREKNEKQLDNILSQFYPGVWVGLKRSIQNDPDVRRKFLGLGLSLLDMRRRFPGYVIDNLENAFRNQEDYFYSLPGKRRDLRVSTKMCEDGDFKAWYTSEYAGTGNGQYYVLINPHYATFMERD